MPQSALQKQLKFLYRLYKALHQDSHDSVRLSFNVLGHHYEAPLSILNNYPDTLLGEPKLRAAYYDHSKDEFVFDRHPQAFESILTFYLSDGKSLSKPDGMPSEIFYEERKFFRLQPSILGSYYDQEIVPTLDIQIVPKSTFRRYLWLLLNYSTHDWKSQIVRTTDFTLNLIALWVYARDCSSDQQTSQIMYWIREANGQILRPVHMLFHWHMSTLTIDLLCTTIFALQLCARLYSAPTVRQIYSETCFWLELLSVLPNIFMYLVLALQRHQKVYFQSSLTLIAILRSFRIFRFTRQITGLRVLLSALVCSTRELFHLFIILITVILAFGECIYLMEEWRKDSSIQTVADGYWLTALTVTSLGYGDSYPTHPYSRALMSVCSIAGLIVIAMLVPGIYRHFERMYQAAKRKRRLVRYIHSDQTVLRL